MPVKALLILATISLGIAYGAWDMLRPPASNMAPALNIQENVEIVPNPAFTSINGTTYNLHDFAGKIIVLNFWATWCVPCIAEFPQLLELAAREPDRLVFIALSVDEQPEKIKPFFDQFDAATRQSLNLKNVVIAHDPGKAISQDLFQTVRYPETLIIGPDLIMRKKIVGITDWLSLDLL